MEQKIKENIETKDAIIIKENNDSPKMWDSKAGGKPYLLEEDDYPVSLETGEIFEFLIQINCRDLPENQLFPQKGLLQFFINHDYNYDEDDLPFVIKYIENIVIDENRIDYDLEDDYEMDEQAELDEASESLLIDEEEIKLDFILEKDYINPTTSEWLIFKEKINDKFNICFDDLSEDNQFVEDLDIVLNNEDVLDIKYASKLLGYPANHDTDIRLSNEKYQDYILLLQLSCDSDFFANEDEINICWFIHPDDLVNLKFDKAICSYF